MTPLSNGVWRHISYKDVSGFGRVPSNGLVVLGRDGVLLVDTPWTPAQTRLLLSWVDGTLRAPVRDVIVTHGHDDRMGGLPALPSTTRLHALPMTLRRAAEQQVTLDANELPPQQTLELSGVRTEVLFPGHGHAPDNLLVSFPDRQLLFGGCFVKDAHAANLGNVADADLASWQRAISLTISRFPEPIVVVPGHGDPGGTELLRHTRDLLNEKLPHSEESPNSTQPEQSRH